MTHGEGPRAGNAILRAEEHMHTLRLLRESLMVHP